MRVRSAVRLLFFLAAGLTGCVTARDNNPGQRVLDAVVVGREFEAASGAQTGPWGFDKLHQETGNWYLVFEGRDGEATARYRLSVSQQQYMFFQEGADVQITLVGYELRALRRRP